MSKFQLNWRDKEFDNPGVSSLGLISSTTAYASPPYIPHLPPACCQTNSDLLIPRLRMGPSSRPPLTSSTHPHLPLSSAPLGYLVFACITHLISDWGYAGPLATFTRLCLSCFALCQKPWNSLRYFNLSGHTEESLEGKATDNRRGRFYN